jgi:CheY-like chemotaxis protein
VNGPLDLRGSTDAPGGAWTGPQGERPCVLFVDDEVNVQNAVRRLLRREPYDLLLVSSGQEALEVLKQRRVQLVISDQRMPGMTGTELLRQVRLRWPETIRVILSGYAEVNTIIAAINEGEIYKYLTKPWNDEEIKLHIRRAIEQHALQEENRRLTREVAKQNEELRALAEQLDRRAASAAMRLSLAQELLEVIDVGVLTINGAGLIVEANRWAREVLLAGRPDPSGADIWKALPEELCARISSDAGVHDDARGGVLEIDGAEIQWRCQGLGGGPHWGIVLTFWENKQTSSCTITDV